MLELIKNQRFLIFLFLGIGLVGAACGDDDDDDVTFDNREVTYELSANEKGGDIAYFLGPVDGLAAAEGISYAIVDESYDFLIDYDGYINIHESNAAIGNVVSQGNIGSNAE